ncbi:MAG: hypothetical protein IPK10_08010 [Bacteroidetes bacterium]|nr:hypothetical protein [Bacteroidota bacterium]
MFTILLEFTFNNTTNHTRNIIFVTKMLLIRLNHVGYLDQKGISNFLFSPNSFSLASKFNLTPIDLTNPAPSKENSLSCSYNIKINSTSTCYISVFHNLFYPVAIFNNSIEKINWSLKSKGKIICSGNVASGHNFEFDESLISGSNGVTSKSLSEINFGLYQSIRHKLEELNKHFFHFEMDLTEEEEGTTEYELKFDFPDFKPGYSVNDVKFSFNNVVPVIDVIRKQESFEGLKKGFNLWTLSKTDSSNFLGISSVLLKNRNNLTEQISELDFENSTESVSNYKLLAPENYADKEQELLYLKNYIPLPLW